MKASEIRTMNSDQKALALSDLSKQVVQLRIQAATERLHSVGQIREARKDIARVKTILREEALVSVRAEEEKAETVAAQDRNKAFLAAVARRKDLKRLHEEGIKRAKEAPKGKGKGKGSKAKAKTVAKPAKTASEKSKGK